MRRPKVLLLISSAAALIAVCGSIYLLPHILFMKGVRAFFPPEVLTHVQAKQVSLDWKGIRSQDVFLVFADAVFLEADRLRFRVDPADLFSNETPVAVQLEAGRVTREGRVPDWGVITLDLLSMQTVYRGSGSIAVEACSGSGNFGTFEMRGSISSSVLDLRADLRIITDFLYTLPGISDDALDIDEPIYPVNIRITGPPMRPEIAVESQYFTFHVKENAE